MCIRDRVDIEDIVDQRQIRSVDSQTLSRFFPVSLMANFLLSAQSTSSVQSYDCFVCVTVGGVSRCIIHKEGCMDSRLSGYVIDGEQEGAYDAPLRERVTRLSEETGDKLSPPSK